MQIAADRAQRINLRAMKFLVANAKGSFRSGECVPQSFGFIDRLLQLLPVTAHGAKLESGLHLHPPFWSCVSHDGGEEIEPVLGAQ